MYYADMVEYIPTPGADVDTTLVELTNSLVSLSGPAVIALILILVIRGDLVPRSALRSVESERDAWKETAEQAIELGFAALRKQE